ncbi:minor tail protein [Microbacterium phage EdElric]|nr:minor tail protein [Microbacterium phage EdElric]UUG69950.1 minor tail protein [Microbacterium phage KyriosFaba]
MALRQLEEAVRNLQRRVGEILQQLAPVGTIHAFGGSNAPANYVPLDGRQLSRTEYAALFALIGVTYGPGNGSTTFNVPDARGRALVGIDTAQTEFNALGKTGGAKTHTLTEAQLPSHTHGVGANADGFAAHRTNTTGGYRAVFASGSTGEVFDYRAPAAAGGGQAHNNLQPYLTVTYVIKAK